MNGPSVSQSVLWFWDAFSITLVIGLVLFTAARFASRRFDEFIARKWFGGGAPPPPSQKAVPVVQNEDLATSLRRKDPGSPWRH